MTRAACLDRSFHDVDADPQAHVAVLVGKRCLDEGDIEFDDALADQGRNLGKKQGRVVGKPLVDGIAGVVTDEKRIEPEIALEFFMGIGRHAQGPDMEDLGVEKCLGVFVDIIGQRLHQVLRLAAGRADKYPVAPVDMLEYRRLRANLSG